MSLNKENQLKFDEGKTTESLTIIKAGIEELEFGPKHIVHIKQLIDGYDHFIPSDGLIDKLKNENVDVGDKITIEKVAPSDKYKYGYFSVKVVEKNAQGNKEVMDQYSTGEIKPVEPSVQPMHKSVAKFEEQFKKPEEDKMDKHELSNRVERLETIVATLWEDYGSRTSDAGHKPGDEKLPF
tara:strand:+ start:579 stop:1124 length:546 start_codon:yes stop_codon:yes gene_type:complete